MQIRTLFYYEIIYKSKKPFFKNLYLKSIFLHKQINLSSKSCVDF